MVCKNCHAELDDDQNFCYQCGAKVIRNRLTPKIIAKQINEEFISIDNRLLQTLIDLMRKPDSVINGYINGLRKRYVGVISYYAIALTVLGFQVFLLKTFFPDFFESQSNAMVTGFNATGPQAKNAFTDGMQIASGWLMEYQGILFTMLMPLLAVGTWLLYLDKRVHNYTEHIVINLYTNSQTIFFSFVIYIAFALFGVTDYVTASLIVSPLTILYGAYVFKCLYKESYIISVVRYLAAFFIYLIVFGMIMAIVMIIFFIYLYSSGKLQP